MENPFKPVTPQTDEEAHPTQEPTPFVLSNKINAILNTLGDRRKVTFVNKDNPDLKGGVTKIDEDHVNVYYGDRLTRFSRINGSWKTEDNQFTLKELDEVTTVLASV